MTPITTTSRTVVPMRPGATVRPPDDHDDDDPHFNVSFFALLNTSTPVKPKSRARAKQPLIFRQQNSLHTHSEHSASSQVPSQMSSERRLPLYHPRIHKLILPCLARSLSTQNSFSCLILTTKPNKALLPVLRPRAPGLAGCTSLLQHFSLEGTQGCFGA